MSLRLFAGIAAALSVLYALATSSFAILVIAVVLILLLGLT
jgi:hypothetical protein